MPKPAKIIPFNSRQRLMATMDKTAKHNYLALIFDGVCFAIGAAFLDANTVLPSLIGTLTHNNLLIGLATTIRNAGYLLPQLLVAGYAERLAFKKPLLGLSGTVNRLSVLFMALTVFFFAGSNMNLALAGLLFFLCLFALTDGISGAPWTDLVAKAIPLNQRGRLFGTMQSLGGVGAFFAGVLIRQILVGVKFPLNYTMLFSLSFVFMAASLVGTLLVREPAGSVRGGSSFIAFLYRLPLAWRASPIFQKMMFTRMLLSCFHLSLPFYIVFAREKLGLPGSSAGLFLAAQMAGSVLASLLWGYLGDKHGNRLVIRLTSLITASTPVLAFGAGLISQANLGLAFATCLLVFATIGATLSGNWIGFTNYLLEAVPDVDRLVYVGMMNTLTAPFTFLPVVGGFLLRFLPYEILFATTCCFLVGSLLLAIRLPEPRLSISKKN